MTEPASYHKSLPRKAESLVQRSLEDSNVELVTELTDELMTLRTFQANMRAYETGTQIVTETINLLR